MPDPAELGTRFQSSPTHVSHHPDSVRALTLSDTEPEISLDESMESLVLKWMTGLRYREAPSTGDRPFLSIQGGAGQSADLGRRQNLGGPERAQTRPFAVLWSKEVTLAAVRSALDLENASAETARTRIDRRLAAYEDTLRIDLYQFFREDGFVDDVQDTKVTLVDQANHQSPLVNRKSVSGRTTIKGESMYYARTSFFFARGNTFKETSQLLLNASNLLTGGNGEDPRRFEWTWTDE